MATDKEIERKELDTLTGAPLTLTFGGKEYKVAEPTLAVLDEMSKCWVDIPEINIKGGAAAAISEAKALLGKTSKIMAKSIGIAMAGERYFSLYGRFLARKYARLVYVSATTKELRKAAEALTVHGGIVDFIASMQLMSIARTTRPTKSIE